MLDLSTLKARLPGRRKLITALTATGFLASGTAYQTGDRYAQADQQVASVKQRLEKAYASTGVMDRTALELARDRSGPRLAQMPLSFDGWSGWETEDVRLASEQEVLVMTDPRHSSRALILARQSGGLPLEKDRYSCQLVVFGETGFRSPPLVHAYSAQKATRRCLDQLSYLYRFALAQADRYLLSRFGERRPRYKDLKQAVADFRKASSSGVKVRVDLTLPDEFARSRRAELRWRLYASPEADMVSHGEDTPDYHTQYGLARLADRTYPSCEQDSPNEGIRPC